WNREQHAIQMYKDSRLLKWGEKISTLRNQSRLPFGFFDIVTTLGFQRCSGCGDNIGSDSPAVFAEHAGYHAALWHPACFTCAECGQGLADLVYFWSDRRLLCGRHYCQSVRPRCSGCDEVRN
uniref:LIM zinc-binding domain-containing protein n=1 Tax=Hippocampus comes TaxID=109280 RepID=A0A3Q2YRC4_HIPCM